MPPVEDPDNEVANRLCEDWKQQYEFRFFHFMQEMDTPFWHLVMKDLMDKTFGPLK